MDLPQIVGAKQELFIMKLALQLNLIPYTKTEDKVKWAADHGVEGLELSVFSGLETMYAQADAAKGLIPICSVCANATPTGERGFDFLNPDKAKRRASIDGSKAILEFCGNVGAVGQIVPPIFGPPVVPDLSPVISIAELEEQLMIAACEELGPYAAERKTLFMLEPLNRYEQHYLRKQEDGVRVIKKLSKEARKGVGLLSDFFHMHIEELNTPETFKKIGKFTDHIHLADNTRQEPGSGDIDYVASFKVLKKIGFKGYMAYECGVQGATPKKKRDNLAKSLDYLRSCISKAK